jgi:hypothetical protein
MMFFFYYLLGEAFHTALWKADFGPKGKKVAVIGTGASAVQVLNIVRQSVGISRPNLDPMPTYLVLTLPCISGRLLGILKLFVNTGILPVLLRGKYRSGTGNTCSSHPLPWYAGLNVFCYNKRVECVTGTCMYS